MAKYNTITDVSYGLSSPLISAIPRPVISQRAPTTADFSTVGQIWIDETTDRYYALTSIANNLANWELIGGQGGAPITQYVVDADGTGDYVTIQEALTAADASGLDAMIYVRPGTYTENLTLYDGQTIAANGLDTVITGVHTPPAAGTLSFQNISLTSATDILTSAVAGTTAIRFYNCLLNCTNGFVVDCANWTGGIIFEQCTTASTADGIVNIGAAAVMIRDSILGAGATAGVVTGGSLTIYNSNIVNPLSPAGACAVVIDQGSILNGTYTTAGTVTTAINNATLSTGANAAISHGSAGVFSITESTINSANATPIGGAGAGIMSLGHVSFTQNSAIAGTLTLAYLRATDRVTPFVVGATGNYATIQAAINDANTIGTSALIRIQPGAYTEDLTLYDGIILEGSGLDTVITGVHTPPAAGIITLQNMNLESATDIVTSAAAGTTRMIFFNCLINCTNGYIADVANWTGVIDIVQCADVSTINGIVNNQSTSTVGIWDSVLGAGAGTVNKTGGSLNLYNSRIVTPIAIAGATTFTAIMGCSFGGILTSAGTSTVQITNSMFSTGATAAITQGSAGILQLSCVSIDTSNNPAIAGAGVGAVYLSGVEFLDGSNLAATLTMNYGPETRTTKILAGDSTYRVNVFNVNNNIIQAYADDATAAGASALNAIEGNLTVSAGDGGHSPDAVQGSITASAGSNSLSLFGVRGYCNQVDGSIIASTAAGVEGHLDLLETGAGDLPAFYAFAVKGYLDSTDGAGIPGGMTAGIGSVVEYNTPFDAKAYGFLATRLNSGAGAGTAAQAAFGVLQGTISADDWLYGIDLYNGGTGVAYTNADIRLQNQSNIAVDTLGAEFSGDWKCRSCNPTNINITEIHFNPICQSILTTGVAPTGATGDTNIIYLQDNMTMEQFILGAGQTIIAPRLGNTGIDIALDKSVAEGAEYYPGYTSFAYPRFIVGTSPAFFIEAKLYVADTGSSDPLVIGFRAPSAPHAASIENYTDAACIGLAQTEGADVIYIGTGLNGLAWTWTSTTDAWTDGQTKTLRVNVSAAGVVTYLIDGVAPTQTAAFTFDNGDTLIWFINHRFLAAGGAPGVIGLQSLKIGYQAWN